MKKFFICVAILAAASISSFTQAQAQAQIQQPVLSPVLTDYYGIKDALFSGDAKTAAVKAGEMLKAVNGVDLSTLSASEHKTFIALQAKLAFDSRHISESSDINHQREHFTSLSANMVSLSKQTRLAQQPIYEDYCPMKKAHWLSNDIAIKNPYFGGTMPGCGKVTNTIKP
jgi:hypothetical protein